MLTNLYFALLRYLRPFFEKCDVSQFPVELFYFEDLPNGSFSDWMRLGGLYTHLKKTQSIPESVKSKPEISLEFELFDDVLLLYHLAISAQFKALSIHMQHQFQSIVKLEETNSRIAKVLAPKEVPQTPEEVQKALDHLKFFARVFLKETIDYVRISVWQQTYLSWPGNLLEIWNSVLYGFHLLTEMEAHPKYPMQSEDPSQEAVSAIGWVSEYWLDALIDSFHALRRADFAFSESKSPPIRH